MANTLFLTAQGKIFEGAGYGWFNWWRPGAAGRTIVDGSNPPQLVPPIAPPTYQHAALYNDDDEFSDGTNLQRVISSVAIPPVAAPTWNANKFGLTEDSNGNIYMTMGPIGGVPFGHRTGGITIKLGGKTAPFQPDGARAPILHFFTSDDAQVELELAQTDLNLMAYAVPQGQYTSGTDALLPANAQAYTMATFGGLNSPRMPSPSIVVAMPKKSTVSPTKCIVFTMYKGCSKGEISPVFIQGKETGYKMTFGGEAVYSRADYDQVCQWYEMT